MRVFGEDQCAQDAVQPALLVAEVRLHDRREPLEVPVEGVDGRPLLHRTVELPEQMSDHAVVLPQLRDRLAELGMLRFELGEQQVVLAAMVRVQSDAEAVAVEQQVPVNVGPLSDAQCVTKSAVGCPELKIPRDEPLDLRQRCLRRQRERCPSPATADR